MGTVLKVIYEGIGDAKSTIDLQKENFDELYQTLKTTINNLPEYWEGDAAEGYIQQFSDLSSSFDAIGNLLADLSKQLGNISTNYASNDSGMANQLGVTG